MEHQGPCSQLAPFTASQSPCKRFTGFRILENSRSAVALEASAEFADGASGTLQLRVTTGQPIVEVRGSNRISELGVLAHPHFVTLPDFFGDDQVFVQPESLARPIASGKHDSAVWRHGPDHDDGLAAGRATLRRGCGTANVKQPWSGCAVQLVSDEPLWVALLQGSQLWHAESFSAGETNRERPLAWQPPFPAKWRADFADEAGLAQSWYFADSESAAEGTAANSACPCRLEGGRVIAGLTPEMAKQGTNVLLYPMDRSRATPLTAILPIDVLLKHGRRRTVPIPAESRRARGRR